MDIVKMYAIVLVVFGHVIQTFDTQWDKNLLELGIYMFHMPLFIAVSGYFFTKSAEKYQFAVLIRKRFVQIMLPSLTMGCLDCLRYGGGRLLKHIEVDSTVLIKMLTDGLWFLTVLFVLTVIGATIHKCCKESFVKYYIVWGLVWTIFYFLPDFWVFNQIEFLMPFYVLGIAFRNVDFSKIRVLPVLIAAVVFVVCLAHFNFDATVYNMSSDCLSQQYLKYTGLRLAGGVSGIVVSLYICKWINKIPAPALRFLAHIGTITLPIYVLHQKFLLINIFILKFTIENTLCLMLITGALLILTILTYNILRKNKYVALFLFGETARINA